MISFTCSASVVILGVFVTGHILSKIPLYYEMDEVTLVALDENLADQIGEASTRHLRGESEPDKEPDSSSSPLDILEQEAQSSGITPEDLWGDNGEDWIVPETNEPTEGVEHRRLLQEILLDAHRKQSVVVPTDDTVISEESPSDEESNLLASKMLPALVATVAGLVLVCACVLCAFEYWDRRLHKQEAGEELSLSIKDPSSAPQNQSSFAQSSYICTLAAEQPVLPPVDCCVLGDDEASLEGPLSQVSSLSASLQAGNNNRNNSTQIVADDDEVASNPRDSPVPDSVDMVSDEDSIESPMQGFSSPDRSGVSALTEQSNISKPEEETRSVKSSQSSHPFDEPSDSVDSEKGNVSVAPSRCGSDASKSSNLSCQRSVDSSHSEAIVTRKEISELEDQDISGNETSAIDYTAEDLPCTEFDACMEWFYSENPEELKQVAKQKRTPAKPKRVALDVVLGVENKSLASSNFTDSTSQLEDSSTQADEIMQADILITSSAAEL